MELKCLGGVNEIGGNAFLLKNADTHILLDFGKSFKQEGRFFSGFLKARTSKGLQDFFELGILPEIDGFYSSDLRLNKKDTNITACFLSHAHLDHFGNINLLNEKIPIFMGETAKTIIQSIQDTSRVPFGRPFIRDATDEVPSNVRTFRTGDVFQLGTMEIIPIHVDHSIPGSYGYIIKGNKTIVYSGDLRLHGWRKDLTKDFIQEAKNSNPDILLMEGTNINEVSTMDEIQVREDISKTIASTKELVIANYSLRDIDRFRSFYLATKENGRKLLINTKQAYLLKMLQDDPNLDIPSVTDPHIQVYKRSKTKFYKWEEQLFEELHLVEKNNFDQSTAVFHCDFWNLPDLIDIKPKQHSTYLYSHGDPFDIEGELDFNRMMEWINHYNLKFKQYHASGHASQYDLIKIVNKIEPDLVIPIHSEQPELYEDLIEIPVLLPKKYHNIHL